MFGQTYNWEAILKIILPKTSVNLGKEKGPLFFLAGPVRGGGNWQEDMSRRLAEMTPRCITAIPCRWNATNYLYRYRIKGDENHFPRQLDWERHYIEQAAREHRSGCLVFWLGCESKIEPHPGPEPYGMDTRGEIARWSVHKKYDPRVRMVVGADPEFLGLSQIQRNINADLGYEFHIHDSIEDTAEAAALTTVF